MNNWNKEFIKGYIEAMYFTQGGPDDDTGFDEAELSLDALKKIVRDCQSFYFGATEISGFDFDDDAQAGQDFWFTRNGHGAGFWDGDYPEDEGDALTQRADGYGEIDAYVGDDGKIYL